MRLIDADKIMADIATSARSTSKDYSLLSIARYIRIQPTIEAEPVRHGWWTVTYLKHIELANDEGHVYIHFAKCSECGNEAIMQFVDYNESFKEWYTDYCPHCGAKMK